MYHLIFVCKYRKKLLNLYSSEIKNILKNIEKDYDFKILKMECEKDHIHLLIESEPKVSILQIVRALKSRSTIELWKKHSKELRKYFWKQNIFWSRGYFVCTIGNASEETVKKYIERHG